MSPFRPAAARAYQNIALETTVSGASPHLLVVMLFDGALGAIVDARQQMRARNVPAKGAAISKAISIIADGLRLSLDMERGGSIAGQLKGLYDYMTTRLVVANLHNREDILAEIHALLCELRAAWVQIGQRPELMAAPSSAPVPERDRRAVSYGAA